MKTLLFALIFSAAAATAMAQSNAPAGSAEMRAKTLTQEMLSRYGLDESAYIRLKTLNLGHLRKLEDINRMTGTDKAAREQQVQDEQQAYQQSLQDIMRPTQYEAYLADARKKQ